MAQPSTWAVVFLIFLVVGMGAGAILTAGSWVWLVGLTAAIITLIVSVVWNVTFLKGISVITLAITAGGTIITFMLGKWKWF